MFEVPVSVPMEDCSIDMDLSIFSLVPTPTPPLQENLEITPPPPYTPTPPSKRRRPAAASSIHLEITPPSPCTPTPPPKRRRPAAASPVPPPTPREGEEDHEEGEGQRGIDGFSVNELKCHPIQ